MNIEDLIRAAVRSELEPFLKEVRALAQRKGATRGEEFLTVGEAADLIKVNPSTIREWIREGRLRAHQPQPRVIRIRREDLDEALSVARRHDNASPDERAIALLNGTSKRRSR